MSYPQQPDDGRPDKLKDLTIGDDVQILAYGEQQWVTVTGWVSQMSRDLGVSIDFIDFRASRTDGTKHYVRSYRWDDIIDR